MQSKPGHRFENATGHVFSGSFDVGIFDTKDEFAVVLSGKQPVEQSRSGAAHMQVSRGRRCEAHANRLAHRLTFRSAATASRTPSTLESSVRGRIGSLEAGSPARATHG